MGKLILLIILGLVVGMYFPDSRAVLLEKGEPALRPVLRWNAVSEMEKIAQGVQTLENVERRVPAKGEWLKWVNANYVGDAVRDPWGSVYGYEVQPDSFAIHSNGPDRLMKTEDDIRVVFVRNWRAKGPGRP